MNTRTVHVIWQKELIDVLRDKRTLFVMLGVPFLLYPALFLFGSQMTLHQLHKVERAVSKVTVCAQPPEPLTGWLDEIRLVDVVASLDPASDLEEGRVDAVVTTEEDVEDQLRRGSAASILIRYDATEGRSTEAARRIERGLEKVKERLMVSRLATAGLPDGYVTPLRISRRNVATPARTTGAVLGMIIPVLIIIMLGVGAFYPAIDLTAGEKERGTFETLLSTPAAKSEIVTGKFLTVFCVCLITGLLNLGSLVLTVSFQLSLLKDQIGEYHIQFPPHFLPLSFLAFLPLALFISAATMTIAVFARSFREAQSLIVPFFLLLVFPASLAAVPGARLSTATQFIPIANAALLFKDLVTGKGTVEGVSAVVISMSVYAALALACASWAFQREEVVLSEERGLPVTWNRSRFPPQSTPTPGMSVLMFCASALLIFYIGTYAQARNVFSGLIITQWLLILLPTLLFLWYARVNLRSALALRVPSGGQFAAALLTATGWIVLAIQVGLWHNRFFPLPPEMAEQLEGLFRIEKTGVGVPALLFILAVSPAICEETLFRGAVLSGLRRRLPGWAAISAVAALFAVSHLVVYRMVLTALSGAVLTYLVWRSRSLFTGVLAHFLINATSVLAKTGRLPKPLQGFLEEQTIEEHGLPGWLLGAASVAFLLGILLMEKASKESATVEGDRHER